jgi:hypothetical protein
MARGDLVICGIMIAMPTGSIAEMLVRAALTI